MSIYELLAKIILVNKFRISSSVFSDEEKMLLDDEKEQEVFELLKNISSIAVKITNKEISFGPSMVWEGKRTYSIEDISEEDYTILKSLKLKDIPLNLRALIADILWTQKREYRYAVIALEAYLEIIKLLYPNEETFDTLDIIKRAICISIQTKNIKKSEELCQIIYDGISVLSDKNEGFFLLRLLEVLIEENYGNISELLKVADNIIRKHHNNISKIELAYEIKIKCLNKLKKKELIKHTNLELAAYYIDSAEKIVGENINSSINAELLFCKAINLYRNNGEAFKGEVIHRRLIEVQKEIPQQMVLITTNIDVSEVIANIKENMEHLTFEESIIRLTQMIVFPKKEDEKKKMLKEYKDNFISSHMFSKNVINSTGQTLLSLKPLDYKNPENNKELLDMHLHQWLLEKERMLGSIWIKPSLRYIKEIYDFKEDDLDFLISNNPIIPEGRERIFRSAIYRALKGQYYESIHILAPQVENLFRNIAKAVDGLTITLEYDGTSKEKVLSSVFDLPELLESYDNDILFLFRGLLNEQAGANIRNEIAHGILSERDADSGVHLYFIGAVIKLLAYTSIKCHEIIKGNKKLASIKVLKKDALKLENKID